eukprot:CAMPEP_0185296350 /NCGR_PEP_ID=MMETSP1363-20130426/9051_1 /TAXON_ID=38817 /ORGANISM="Gephyrocapsa oceanica, Strain RCC1303" /LENGTH=38 /DNA_ID= /DNA_START= /DNA_END= /DNA_ORIENTATION=
MGGAASSAAAAGGGGGGGCDCGAGVLLSRIRDEKASGG